MSDFSLLGLSENVVGNVTDDDRFYTVNDPEGTPTDGYLLGSSLRAYASVPAVVTVAASGASQTLTRSGAVEDWHITLTASCALTLAGGGVSGKVSEWNVIAKQDGTGGRVLTISTTVVWVGGAPTFATTAAASNHISFVQYGTGTIYGYYAGSAAS